MCMFFPVCLLVLKKCIRPREMFVNNVYPLFRFSDGGRKFSVLTERIISPVSAARVQC